MPLAVRFRAPVPASIQASAELLTAFPQGAEVSESRYLTAHLTGVKVTIMGDGLSANVAGTISLDKGSDQAKQVWVLTIAYDGSGLIVGLRRWEMAAGQVLKAEQQKKFDLSVYSAAGKIERVESIVEARP
jgi:hypothetical protein